MQVLQVGDVPVEAWLSPSDVDLSDIFPLTTDEPRATISISHGFTLDGSQPTPQYHNGQMRVMVSSSGFETDYWGMFRHLGYLAGDISDKYRFVHGMIT